MNRQHAGGSGHRAERCYIIGREGHIYLGDPAVSKQHAELQLVDGRIRLRDLDSTNGIYLLKNDRPVRFREGYVQPDATIVIGNQRYRIQKLLEIIGDYGD